MFDVAYLGQSLQFVNCRRIESSRVSFEVTETILALNTSLFHSNTISTLSKVACVNLTDHAVVSSDGRNVTIRL